MIIPTCRCKPVEFSAPHHPYCPAVAEPQPLNQTQLDAADAYTNHYVSLAITHDIISRKDADGNLLFPNLAAHLEVA